MGRLRIVDGNDLMDEFIRGKGRPSLQGESLEAIRKAKLILVR